MILIGVFIRSTIMATPTNTVYSLVVLRIVDLQRVIGGRECRIIPRPGMHSSNYAGGPRMSHRATWRPSRSCAVRHHQVSIPVHLATYSWPH